MEPDNILLRAEKNPQYTSRVFIILKTL